MGFCDVLDLAEVLFCQKHSIEYTAICIAFTACKSVLLCSKDRKNSLTVFEWKSQTACVQHSEYNFFFVGLLRCQYFLPLSPLSPGSPSLPGIPGFPGNPGSPLVPFRRSTLTLMVSPVERNKSWKINVGL